MKKSRKLQIKKIIKELKPYIIMHKDTEVEADEIHQYKSYILINDIDIIEIVVSNFLV